MQFVRPRHLAGALAITTAAVAFGAAPAGAQSAAEFPCQLGAGQQYSSGAVTASITCSTGGTIAWADRRGLLKPTSSGYDTSEPPTTVRLKPSSKGNAKLAKKCPLKIRVRFTFTPADGSAATKLSKSYKFARGSC
jgi:hypothetical protein